MAARIIRALLNDRPSNKLVDYVLAETGPPILKANWMGRGGREEGSPPLQSSQSISIAHVWQGRIRLFCVGRICFFSSPADKDKAKQTHLEEEEGSESTLPTGDSQKSWDKMPEQYVQCALKTITTKTQRQRHPRGGACHVCV